MNRVLWGRFRMAGFMLGITLTLLSRGDVSQWGLDVAELKCSGWNDHATSRTLTIRWLVRR